MNKYTIDDIHIGLTETFGREISTQMEDSFRDISGDENPLHRSDDFARQISGGRYQKHVVFGMLTASLYSTLAGMYLPGQNSLIHSFEELSFLRPVFAGDVLTVTGEVVDKDSALGLIRIKAVIRNQDNKAVSRAKIKILVMKSKSC